ncbi:MAG: methylated-DNA--[protein]-cysteine S-methyltransferase [Planctomycetota bacterium]|jgi:O-6-methylguanine DNA methyltransferase|nr:methylated-DNA--[protein]-cysteine S-methyltransferase [Planctomycetota bacterium]
MMRKITTPAGEYVALVTARGVSRLFFPGTCPNPSGETEDKSAAAEKWARILDRELKLFHQGKLRRFSVPLDIPASLATPFRLRVWKEMRKIAFGHTLTYGELARRSATLSARATGGACGANPIPILIPCHRVLAAGGRLGGFSAGLEWKRRLLLLEGSFPGEGTRHPPPGA